MGYRQVPAAYNSSMATTTERKPPEEILSEIVLLCFDCLDPILTRQALIRKIRQIYVLAAPDDDPEDGEGGDVDSDDVEIKAKRYKDES